MYQGEGGRDAARRRRCWRSLVGTKHFLGPETVSCCRCAPASGRPQAFKHGVAVESAPKALSRRPEPHLNHALKKIGKIFATFFNQETIMKAKNEARVRWLVETCNECVISNRPLPAPDQVVAALNAVEVGRDIEDDLARYIAATFDMAERAGIPWRIRPAEVIRDRMRGKMIVTPIGFADGTH
jgi:hypothetical protein